MLAHGVDAKPGTVTVNGTGSVDAVPDTATFAFGVTTEAKTAVAALAQDADAATKVIAALKKAGIADKDVQTQSVSLSRADTDALYRAALKEAVAAARTKAEALGEAGQFSVGKIDSLVEGSNEPPVPMSDRAAAPATPIEPGTQQITASVTVSFELS
jgi:uncharacterized protein YggE